MSKFTVRVEHLAYPKGRETTIREEDYYSWKEADTAFCAYRDLAKLKGSSIEHVWLIEHRETIIRKEATKGNTLEHVEGGGVCLLRHA